MVSSRAERPDFILSAVFWCVGPRSRGIPLPLFPSFLPSLCSLRKSFLSFLCDLCVPTSVNSVLPSFFLSAVSVPGVYPGPVGAPSA
jgi:hypothetical protein